MLDEVHAYLSALPDLFDFLPDGFGQREGFGLNLLDGHSPTVTGERKQLVWLLMAADCVAVPRGVLLYPGAGEDSPAVPSLSSVGAERRHTAGVAVAVSHWNTHDAAHGHTGVLIYTHTHTHPLNQPLTT